MTAVICDVNICCNFFFIFAHAREKETIGFTAAVVVVARIYRGKAKSIESNLLTTTTTTTAKKTSKE